jgi:hypothetical protein
MNAEAYSSVICFVAADGIPHAYAFRKKSKGEMERNNGKGAPVRRGGIWYIHT